MFPVVAFAVAAFSMKVSCFPSSALHFPEETNNGVVESVSGIDRFNFRPEWSQGPMGRPRPFPGSRPGGRPSMGPQGSVDYPQGPGGFRPGGSAFTGSFRPQQPQSSGSQPQTFSPEDTASGVFRPQQPQSGVQGPDSLGSAVDTSTTSTTPASVETTTKIPRRDPGYRIINTASCPCTFTSQYKPVCGTDGQTYINISVLQCAQFCGKDVKVYLEGSCGRNNGHPGAISLAY